MTKKLVRKPVIPPGKLRTPVLRGKGFGSTAGCETDCNCWCQCGEVCNYTDCHDSVINKVKPVSQINKLNILRGRKAKKI